LSLDLFAVDEGYAYLFSMPGQKIAWTRENPRVCLEVESVVSQSEWTAIVALGDYEELPDTPAYQPGGLRAREVSQRWGTIRNLRTDPAGMRPSTSKLFAPDCIQPVPERE
jgi:nitroimidazol reductase NimA-like FMN-containing flavoprotein (pyridoxamine 5'-phosphate oxidase superfamily)